MEEKILNAANIVSLLRIVLLFIFIFLIYFGAREVKAISVFLCPLIFLTDYIDGYIARRYGMETKLGSYLDLLGDRVTEIVLWLFFLYLQMIPVWAPLIIFIRGFAVDYVRLKAKKKGKTVYGMLSSRAGKLLVSSSISRGGYALLKLILFTTLSLEFVFSLSLETFVLSLVIFVVIFNLIRGLPVIYEGIKFI